MFPIHRGARFVETSHPMPVIASTGAPIITSYGYNYPVKQYFCQQGDSASPLELSIVEDDQYPNLLALIIIAVVSVILICLLVK